MGTQDIWVLQKLSFEYNISLVQALGISAREQCVILTMILLIQKQSPTIQTEANDSKNVFNCSGIWWFYVGLVMDMDGSLISDLVGSTTQWLEEIYNNLTRFHIQSIDLQTNQVRACTSVYTRMLYFQSGIILGMGSANAIWRYILTSPPNGWAHTQKDPANNLCKNDEIRIPVIQNRLELISMVWNILFNPQMTCACIFFLFFFLQK